MPARIALLAVMAALLTAGVGAGAQTGDRIRGAGLALIWCKTCHLIDDRGTGALFTGVPDFPTIARDPGVTNADIYRRLSAKHVRMPEMPLSHRDKIDLIAYIRSYGRR